MAQIFHRRWNTIAPVSLVTGILMISVGGWALHAIYWSPYTTRVGLPREQPVPFSHKHHVGGLGIDCRYCHTSVEESAFAGMPSTEICMSCHSQLWTAAPLLAPIRQSWVTGEPIRWNRVNDLPDFAYFDHSIHINRGVGCATCHGPLDQMPLTWQHGTLYMKWCLECHKNPGPYLRPKAEVFHMNWAPDSNQGLRALQQIQDLHIRVGQLSDCSICHR